MHFLLCIASGSALLREFCYLLLASADVGGPFVNRSTADRRRVSIALQQVVLKQFYYKTDSSTQPRRFSEEIPLTLMVRSVTLNNRFNDFDESFRLPVCFRMICCREEVLHDRDAKELRIRGREAFAFVSEQIFPRALDKRSLVDNAFCDIRCRCFLHWHHLHKFVILSIMTKRY